MIVRRGVFHKADARAPMHEFVDRHGVVHQAPTGDSELTDWAIGHELILKRKHIGNVTALLDINSGKKHLNLYVPLHKLCWLRKVDVKSREPVAGRLPEAVLGGTKFFVENVVPRKVDLAQIKNHSVLGSYLKGGYHPNGIDKPPAWHYGGWQDFSPSRDEALLYLQSLHEASVSSARVQCDCAMRACVAVVVY